MALGILIAAVIAGGSWLGSTSRSAPAAASVTTGSAVVLSSLACTDGAGGTLVDVSSPMGGSVARATLDGCGYQQGQQLAVQYPSDDPTQISLAGTATTADSVLEHSPLGILLAGLLAIGAAAAVWIHRRPQRPAETVTGPTALLGTAIAEPAEPFVGRHARRDNPDTENPDTDISDALLVGATSAGPARHAPPAQPLPPVDLVFPFASSLAASLRDELFTHRSVPT